MNDQSVLKAFFILCGLIYFVYHLVNSFTKKGENARESPLPTRIICRTESEARAVRLDLRLFVSSKFLVDMERLDAGAKFRDELKTPPGELQQFLEDFAIYFGISTPGEEIETIDDLLNLIEIAPPPETQTTGPTDSN